MKDDLVILQEGQKGKEKGGPPPGPAFTMTIPAFNDGAELPVKYSCSNAPAGDSKGLFWISDHSRG
jgi:hypothetical protein